VNNDAKYKKGRNTKVFSENDKPDYGSPEKENWAHKMDALYEKINTTPLSNNRQRNEFLKQMHDLIAEGQAKAYFKDGYTEAFTRCYQKSLERNKLIEAGKEAAAAPLPPYGITDHGLTITDLKHSIERDPPLIHTGVAASIKQKFEVELPEEIDYGGELLEDAFRASSLPSIYFPQAGGAGLGKGAIVQDQKSFEKFRQKMLETAEEWDTLIHEAMPDHPLAQKMEAALKANTINILRRSGDGYSDNYLCFTMPAYTGLKALVAETNLVPDERMIKVMEASKDTFPVYDCIIQGDEQIQTMVDYQKEKESGSMTPEKAEEYRRLLYTQTAALLPKVRQLTDTVMNNRPEAERLHKLGITDSDPFQLGKYSARGCHALEAALETQLSGLENGWPIEDLAALSSFNYARQSGRGSYLYSQKTKFSDFERYDPPRYPSKECEQYFDKMDALYQSFQEKPITGPDERRRFLNEMQKLILTGLEKNYFINTSGVENCRDLLAQARLRDVAIARGKEPAVYEALRDRSSLVIGAAVEGKSAFESKRSKIFFGRESDEHKALRESYEELSRVKRELGLNPTTKQMRAYLDQIDLVEHNARIYQTEKKGASSEAGKERLKGAKKLEDFAVKERKRFMELLNRDKKPEEKISLKTFRKLRLAEDSMKAMQEFAQMEKLPSDNPDKEAAISRMADVLVHQFANGKSQASARVFDVMGAAVLKQEIMKNDAFVKMANGYFGGKKTGTQLCDDLMSGKCMQKMEKMQGKLAREQEEKLQQLEEAKPKPKKAVVRPSK
ncbi:MAG: hypothetical protein IK078_07930, partial [Lachnospiraceae bacterium]|nr:hypothetical protein [Lachnospiraceae bacterium]